MEMLSMISLCVIAAYDAVLQKSNKLQKQNFIYRKWSAAMHANY